MANMLGKARALHKKVTGKVSDVLSAPARAKARLAKKTADYETDIIKKHRNLGSNNTKPNMQGATGDQRVQAEHQRIRQKYNR